MKRIFYFLLIFIAGIEGRAQFAPQAALPGSTAIYKDSSIIVEWASHCSIQRGWVDIADTTLGKTSSGDSSMALGIADGSVVSLGDGGKAILYFDNPLVNGPGFDFAVFENGFRNPADSNEAYLELATVMVSNDGLNYYTFAAQCHNDTSVQIAGAGDYMDTRKVHNLAGKYISFYGTPFDLDELSAILSLDVNNIHYVKIKDVVGTLSKDHCNYDINHTPINDPYPTPFPTGGFDLDAVAVIHHKYATGITNNDVMPEIVFYPNPVVDRIYLKDISRLIKYKISASSGQILRAAQITESIDINDFNKGLYFIEFESNNGTKTIYRFLKL